MVDTIAPPTRNSATRQSLAARRDECRRGPAAWCSSPRRWPSSTSREMPKASAADMSASSRLSVSNCTDAAPRRADRQPDADFALACDRAREQQVGDVRAPDQQDEAERKKSGVNSSMRFGRQRGRARFGSRTRFAVGFSTALAARRESHTRSSASAWPRDRPGFSRPMMPMPTESSRPAWTWRKWPTSASGAQKSGASDHESPKAFRHHADNWNGTPFTRTVRLSTPGSLAKCRDQARWLRTMAGRRRARRPTV